MKQIITQQGKMRCELTGYMEEWKEKVSIVKAKGEEYMGQQILAGIQKGTNWTEMRR